FWGIYAADKGGSWAVGILVAAAAGGIVALVYAYFAIHLRADQIVGGTAVNFLALGITGFFFVQLYDNNHIPSGVSLLPDVHIGFLGSFFENALGQLSVLTWAALVL